MFGFIEVIWLILGILAVIGWWFLCMCVFGLLVYLNEKRKGEQ